MTPLLFLGGDDERAPLGGVSVRLGRLPAPPKKTGNHTTGVVARISQFYYFVAITISLDQK